MKEQKENQHVLLASRPINNFLKDFVTSLVWVINEAPFIRPAINRFYKELGLHEPSKNPYSSRIHLMKQFFKIKIFVDSEDLNQSHIEVENKPCKEFLEKLVINGARSVPKRHAKKLKEKPIAKFIDIVNDPFDFIKELPVVALEDKVNISVNTTVQISLTDKEKILTHIRDTKLNILED